MNNTISVCICTRNRLDELRMCLQSTQRSTYPLFQIIVSDDSADSKIEHFVVSEYPHVLYVKGPQKGLGANRNCAIAHATGDFILFLDDDARLGHDFIERVVRYSATQKNPLEVIICGVEKNHDTIVYPHEQNFLGFQNVSYRPTQPLSTIVINSTLFPRGFFDKMKFDEELVYGYDEVDIATRARVSGLMIVFCETAMNFHYPSQIGRDSYRSVVEASRLYITFKRYRETEGKPIKAILFLLLAVPHLLLSSLKRRGTSGFVDATRAVRLSLRYIYARLRHRR